LKIFNFHIFQFYKIRNEKEEDYTNEIYQLIYELVGFKAKVVIENRVVEYWIHFLEDKETNKRLISRVLNLASNARSKDNLFSISKSIITPKDVKFTQQLRLPSPEYTFSIKLQDIFYGKLVERDVNSINHILIEPKKNNLDRIFYISDNFYSRSNKYFCRFTSRLPEIPMIDKLLVLIFTPMAKFFPFYANSNKEEDKHGYSHFLTFGCANEFYFTHSFSTEDVKRLNKIRKKINELVLGLYEMETYESEINVLRFLVKQLINKKRFKIITNADWWRIYCHYFPDEFEKLKQNQIPYKSLELKELEGEDNFFKEYLNKLNPKEFFKSRNFENFYSEKIKAENNVYEMNESFINITENSESDSDSESSSSSKCKKKMKKKILNNTFKIENEILDNTLEKEYEINTIEVKCENEKNTNQNENYINKKKYFKNLNNECLNGLGKKYLENLKTTFLPEFQHLEYMEDKRFHTQEGEADLIKERENFKTMREILFKEFNSLACLLREDSVSIVCSLCEGYICSLGNLTYLKGFHKITGWIDPFINEIELNFSFYNNFMNDIKNFSNTTNCNEFKLDKFIACKEQNHIFGFKNPNGGIFLTNSSPVDIIYPCGTKEKLNENLTRENYELIQKKRIDSNITRQKMIKDRAHCLLCDYNFKDFNINEIDKKRKQHFENDKLHKEMIRELIEESFE